MILISLICFHLFIDCWWCSLIFKYLSDCQWFSLVLNDSNLFHKLLIEVHYCLMILACFYFKLMGSVDYQTCFLFMFIDFQWRSTITIDVWTMFTDLSVGLSWCLMSFKDFHLSSMMLIDLYWCIMIVSLLFPLIFDDFL